MIAVFLSGFLLVYINNYLIYEIFFQIKAVLVIVLGYVQGKFSIMARDLESDYRKQYPELLDTACELPVIGGE